MSSSLRECKSRQRAPRATGGGDSRRLARGHLCKGRQRCLAGRLLHAPMQPSHSNARQLRQPWQSGCKVSGGGAASGACKWRLTSQPCPCHESMHTFKRSCSLALKQLTQGKVHAGTCQEVHNDLLLLMGLRSMSAILFTAIRSFDGRSQADLGSGAHMPAAAHRMLCPSAPLSNCHQLRQLRQNCHQLRQNCHQLQQHALGPPVCILLATQTTRCHPAQPACTHLQECHQLG